jgi:hypothetical protein
VLTEDRYKRAQIDWWLKHLLCAPSVQLLRALVRSTEVEVSHG